MKRARSCLLLLILLAIAVPTAYTQETEEDILARARKIFEPIPTSPPDLEGNPITPEKIELGSMLYFDPRLSASAFISCNTCHNLGMGGADYQETSIGHGWQRGPRNSPTVLNSVFNIAQFWDGRAEDLMEQAKGPVRASVEMNNTRENVIETLKSMPEYVEMFESSFPDTDDPVTFNNMARAIEVFEATLLTPDSPFDRYLKGDREALTAREEEGLKLFMDKFCASCHGGVNMGGQDYYPFGVVNKPTEGVRPADDKGRYVVTNTWSDEYVFKSPSLRNIALTLPYFHSGKVWDLKEAVSIMGAVQLGVKYTEEDVDKIVTFLKSTTGVQPKVEYPILPAPTGNTPKPKLD